MDESSPSSLINRVTCIVGSFLNRVAYITVCLVQGRPDVRSQRTRDGIVEPACIRGASYQKSGGDGS